MSHDIDLTVTGGAFASLREMPWHGLGTIVENPLNTLDMLKAGHCDFPVHGAPLKLDHEINLGDYTMPVYVRYQAQSDRHMIVFREHPETGEAQVLGVNGPDYQLWSPRDVFVGFGDGLLNYLGEIGERVERATVGALDEGRKVFMSFQLPNDIKVAADDTVQLYLTISTSWDASASTSARITPIRVVCANTLDMAIKSSIASFTIKRTRNANLQAAQARAAVELFPQYAKQFNDTAAKLLATPISNSRFQKLVTDLWGPGDDASKKAITTWETKQDELMALFAFAETNASGRGTAWAAYNTVVEYADWKTRATGDNPDTTRFARSLGLADGRAIAQPKTDVLGALMAIAGA